MAVTDEELEALSAEFTDLREESAYLRKRLAKVGPQLTELRKRLATAIAEDIRTGRRSQAEVSRLTGYTAERIRQICRAAGVEPPE